MISDDIEHTNSKKRKGHHHQATASNVPLLIQNDGSGGTPYIENESKPNSGRKQTTESRSKKKLKTENFLKPVEFDFGIESAGSLFQPPPVMSSVQPPDPKEFSG